MLDQILSKYPKNQTSLVMVLQDVQSEFGYLPKEALETISTTLSIPSSKVYAVATFYNVLSLEPRGENLIRVCLGTACHVRQAPLILDAVKRDLGIDDGGTTKDKKFTLQSVGCVGACAIGPVIEINEEHHGHMDVRKISRLLAKLSKNEEGGQE